MPPSTKQRDHALNMANAKRIRIADIRRQAARGDLTLHELMLNPPGELADMALIDVLRLRHTTRASASVARLGRLAVHDQINLLMPLGRASIATRTWVACNAEWHRRKDGRRTSVHVIERYRLAA